MLATVPFLWEGERLFLNAEAADGEIVCELLDAGGGPLAGYGGEDAIPIAEDGVRLAVRWRAQERMPAAPASAVQLRVRLRAARLYSYWIE